MPSGRSVRRSSVPEGCNRPIRPASAAAGATPSPPAPASLPMRPRRHRPRLATTLAALAGLPLATAQPPPAQAADQVVLRVYDRAGQRLRWDAFRERQRNGRDATGDNDMLVDPADLTVITPWPLYSTNGKGDGDPALDWPGRPAALALAWPTSEGYSNLILDLPGPGRYDLGQLAARQALLALRTALRKRPDYTPSARFRDQLRRAHRLLTAARHAHEPRSGALGTRALDAAAAATTRLLTEYGVQHARRRHAPLQWGFTLDDVSNAGPDLATISDLAGDDGWVRLVFDPDQPPEHYQPAIEAAHRAGVGVLGEILDSAAMARVNLTDWTHRVERYVAALPTVDEWEVGNEVNGNWLGPDVLAKVAYAATYVKQHTSARTLLTLHWQLGEDEPATSMFTWAARNLTPDLMANIDDVGISVYPEDHPLGLAFDRVFTTLHTRFPEQQLLISELDYWSPDLGHTWWWGSRRDPTETARRAVARFYQAAVLGYPYSGGGTYWWYYRQEALPKNALWHTFAALHRRVTSRPSTAAHPPRSATPPPSATPPSHQNAEP
jgi:hypothetical protein